MEDLKKNTKVGDVYFSLSLVVLVGHRLPINYA